MNETEHLTAALAKMQAEWDAMPESFLRTTKQRDRMQQLSRAMSATENAITALEEL